MATTNGTSETALDPAAETGRWTTLQEAAAELGISRDAVRRRVAARVLRAERRRTVRGPRLFVWLPVGGIPDLAETPTSPGPEDGAAPRGGTDAAHSGADAARGATDVTHDGAAWRDGAPRGAALAVTRAEEMARYTAVLLEPLHAQLKEQAERIGRLQAERDAARAELERALAQAREARQETEETARLAEEAAALREAPPDGRRPWWRFW
jgi:hypothetical protein